MAAMAKWGNKKWKINSQQVVGIQNISFSYTQVDSTENSTDKKNKKKTSAKAKKKKKKNKRKLNPFSLSFETPIHSGMGVKNVFAEIKSWKKLVTKVNYFYLNDKKISPKKLQLKQVSVSNVKTNNDGKILYADLSFTLEEYDAKTTSVKVKDSVKKSKAKGIKNGSYVKITGNKYSDGSAVPNSAKDRNYKVTKISGTKALLGNINKWMPLNGLSLIK